MERWKPLRFNYPIEQYLVFIVWWDFFRSPTVVVDGLKRGFNAVRWLDANAVAKRWGRRVFLFFLSFTLRLERHLPYTSRVETYSTAKASWHSPTEIIFPRTAKVAFECSADALISFFKLALERLKLASKIFCLKNPPSGCSWCYRWSALCANTLFHIHTHTHIYIYSSFWQLSWKWKFYVSGSCVKTLRSRWWKINALEVSQRPFPPRLFVVAETVETKQPFRACNIDAYYSFLFLLFVWWMLPPMSITRHVCARPARLSASISRCSCAICTRHW